MYVYICMYARIYVNVHVCRYRYTTISAHIKYYSSMIHYIYIYIYIYITGKYDDLEAIGKYAQDMDIWYHVDAAFGFWILLADEPYRSLIKGIYIAYHDVFIDLFVGVVVVVANICDNFHRYRYRSG